MRCLIFILNYVNFSFPSKPLFYLYGYFLRFHKTSFSRSFYYTEILSLLPVYDNMFKGSKMFVAKKALNALPSFL